MYHIFGFNKQGAPCIAHPMDVLTLNEAVTTAQSMLAEGNGIATAVIVRGLVTTDPGKLTAQFNVFPMYLETKKGKDDS